MSQLATGALYFGSMAPIAVADYGNDRDTFSRTGLTSAKDPVFTGHGYPLNGSVYYGPWGAQSYSVWTMDLELVISGGLGCDIYGIIKENQPLVSPNLITPVTGDKYHVLWGAEEKDPGTAIILTGICYLQSEGAWQYFVTAAADKSLLLQYATPGAMPLGWEYSPLDYNEHWGEPVNTSNYRRSPGIGSRFGIVDADSMTVSGFSENAIMYSPDTGFFTDKSFDRQWCGAYLRSWLGAELPWNTPLGNMVYEFDPNPST